MNTIFKRGRKKFAPRSKKSRPHKPLHSSASRKSVRQASPQEYEDINEPVFTPSGHGLITAFKLRGALPAGHTQRLESPSARYFLPDEQSEREFEALSRMNSMQEDLMMRPGKPVSSPEFTPISPFEYVSDKVDEDFGEKVCKAFELSLHNQCIRVAMYGVQIADQWKCGYTPEEAREKWVTRREEFEEFSGSDEEVNERRIWDMTQYKRKTRELTDQFLRDCREVMPWRYGSVTSKEHTVS